MPAPDFHLAPPPVMVDGLLAVPVHFRDVRATVIFDGAASTARADVTVTYEVGPTGGCPLFDLRQAVEHAWVDKVPLEAGDLAARDVGAGAFSTVRVLAVEQAAGSVHSLRLIYPLATPDVELGGASLPVLAWSAGPRLEWTSGMSDLYAGRYLETWLPSNLIWDRFPVRMTIQLGGTSVPHTVITNGTLGSTRAGSWTVQFPDWFAPMSQLLEIRPSDTVERATRAVDLPVRGRITVEAYKLAGTAIDLGAQLTRAEGFLRANELDYGPYLHDRYLAFFRGARGGMEYAGATTTTVAALQHETFHSWFARGVTPASQADAWWDEGFTTYHDEGADDAEPFDFGAAPVVLCSRQPFQRRTASNAYDDGCRFFRGVAAAVGVGRLRAAMRDVYERRRGTSMSTAMLEEDLVVRTGAPVLVDAFHRFVYGFHDQARASRLWLRDAPEHTGGDPWSGEFRDSPDLWIRHGDDGGTTHQPPRSGQDNWFYATVRNDPAGAPCRHFVVTFAVKEFGGTQFTYPNDFLPAVAARAAFDLPSGGQRVVSARWPADLVPPAGTQLSMLAAVITRGGHPPAGSRVWERGSLAQKDMAVVGLQAVE